MVGVADVLVVAVRFAERGCPINCATEICPKGLETPEMTGVAPRKEIFDVAGKNWSEPKTGTPAQTAIGLVAGSGER